MLNYLYLRCIDIYDEFRDISYCHTVYETHIKICNIYYKIIS